MRPRARPRHPGLADLTHSLPASPQHSQCQQKTGVCTSTDQQPSHRFGRERYSRLNAWQVSVAFGDWSLATTLARSGGLEAAAFPAPPVDEAHIGSVVLHNCAARSCTEAPGPVTDDARACPAYRASRSARPAGDMTEFDAGRAGGSRSVASRRTSGRGPQSE